MFRIILIITVIGSSVWLYITFKRSNMTVNKLWRTVREEFSVFKKFREDQAGQVFVKLRKSTYLLTLIFFLVLALSAYLQVMIWGGPLTGWLLIIHVTAAPLFAISLMLNILVWPQQKRFNQQDWYYLRQILRQKKILLLRSNDVEFWNKLIFWIFMLGAIPAILAIVLQLYPVFGSAGMENLLSVHRYSTLILFVTVVIHWRLLLQRLNN
jgi:cytochrome b subunit of formate dehydrogenase